MKNKTIFLIVGLLSITLFSCHHGQSDRQPRKLTDPCPFEIGEIDLGDKAWGLNLLKVHAKNTSDQERFLIVHIGGRVPDASGFGIGNVYTIAAGSEPWIEHWYWIPPGHGSFDVHVRFKEAASASPTWEEEPFLVKTFSFYFPMPNSRCNNLTITDKLPDFKKWYPDVRHLDPFESITTDHFVFYYSPGTPAQQDIKTIVISHESAMMTLCKFASVTPPGQKIAVFSYPDQTTKRMCTGHTGDGLARGNMIAQVYNDRVKLDPNHELAHLVMGQIGSPPALFNEGFAVYMQTGSVWKNRPVDQTALELLKQGKLPSLKALLARNEIGARNDDGQIAYPASASFVKFLIERYGKEKFLTAWRTLKNDNPVKEVRKNLSDIQAIFGDSPNQLETKWHQWLTQTYSRQV